MTHRLSRIEQPMPKKRWWETGSGIRSRVHRVGVAGRTENLDLEVIEANQQQVRDDADIACLRNDPAHVPVSATIRRRKYDAKIMAKERQWTAGETDHALTRLHDNTLLEVPTGEVETNCPWPDFTRVRLGKTGPNAPALFICSLNRAKAVEKLLLDKQMLRNYNTRVGLSFA